MPKIEIQEEVERCQKSIEEMVQRTDSNSSPYNYGSSVSFTPPDQSSYAHLKPKFRQLTDGDWVTDEIWKVLMTQITPLFPQREGEVDLEWELNFDIDLSYDKQDK